MTYLDEEAAKFLYPYLMEAKRKKNGIINIIHSQDKDDIFQLRFISETSLGIKFSLEIPNIFSLTMMSQQGNIVVYKYKDAEHYPERQLLSIDELNLIKDYKPARIFHSIFILFTEAIINVLREKENGTYQKQLKYYSFRSIRFLFLMFIAESNIVTSWGISELKILPNAVLFSVEARHYKGQIQIAYNGGADLFDVSYYDKNILIGQRTGIFFDELIDCIDKKIEFVTEYENS
ncbi:MAG: hypothetical protein ACK5I7_08650 [Anaerotignum sp.]